MGLSAAHDLPATRPEAVHRPMSDFLSRDPIAPTNGSLPLGLAGVKHRPHVVAHVGRPQGPQLSRAANAANNDAGCFDSPCLVSTAVAPGAQDAGRRIAGCGLFESGVWS